MKAIRSLPVLVFLLLAACGSGIVLLPKPAVTPVGIDLSGDWVLMGTDGSNQGRARETLVYLFVETGKSVKVTQTGDALYVSYNRSVVEEYRFGELRDISLGEVQASRASGWEGTAYVVETLDEDNARLIERWQVDTDDRLQRSIQIISGGALLLSLNQTFHRVQS